MKSKKILFAIFIAIVGILGFTNVNAATISENGKYSLLLITNDENGSIEDGEYAKLIKFDVNAGETTVKVSELTKGITPFNGVNEFSHWVNSNDEKIGDELNISDFSSNGNFYTSTGKEVTYSNGLRIVAKFEGKSLEGSDNYYVTLDAFGGTVNGKSKILLTSASNGFKTIELTKYIPVRDGYTFKGWDLDGKLVTSVDSSDFEKNIITLTATYTQDTFKGDGIVVVLNANGGTIDGKGSNKYDYLGGGNSGTSMSLLSYTPVREGYTFNGWNTKKDGSGANYKYLYWRQWDKDNTSDAERDTLITEESGYERYQNLTLYASWTKNADDTVKEIKSTGKTDGSITFENGVNSNYTLDIKEVEVSKNLSSKSVKYLVDINVLNAGTVVPMQNTKMTIKIKLPSTLKGFDKYQVVYVKDGKIEETIEAKIEGDYLIFNTTHLSEYGIVATKSRDITPATGVMQDVGKYFVIVSSAILALGAIVIIKKKAN